MTAYRVPVGERPGRSRATVRRGGVLLLVGALLQLVATVRVVVPAWQEPIAPIWVLLAWVAGAIVLLPAAVVLAVGRRGETGVVGPSRLGRAALIVSGADGLGVVVLAVGALAGGSALEPGWTVATRAGEVLVLAATVVAAVGAVRAGVLTGAARWALLLVAVVDAATAAVQSIPSLGGAAIWCAYIGRPVALALVAAAVLVSARAAGRGSGPSSG